MPMKSPLTVAKTTNWDSYVSDSDLMPLGGGVVLHGPPKVGKTHMAATASEFFPKTLPATKMVDLEDMLWVGHDAGAVDGFKSVNIKVKYIDALKIIGQHGIAQGLPKLMDLVDKYAQDKRFIVSDTTSALGTAIDGYWGAKQAIKMQEEGGKENTHEMFREILNSHRTYYNRITQLGPQVIFLFHSKIMNEDAVGAMKKKMATYAGGEGSILPDISGQGRKFYIGGASLEGVVVKKKGPKGYSWEFHTETYNGFEGGNRFNYLLDAVEPADLRYILNKVDTKREDKPAEVSNGAAQTVGQ